MRSSKQRFKRSAGTTYGPVGGFRLLIAPWRQSAIASDIEAIDRGEGRMMLCRFRGLYGDYPRPADAPVLLHYIDRLRLHHQDSPPATTS